MIKNWPASVGDREDTGSSPGWGRSPGGGSVSVYVLVHIVYPYDFQYVLPT